ncbi:MAG: T9SS type A sorting domain-containing protein [Fibrobacteres bacterium]|nr:T9SS type A sorting domain-containing protein [Fibrobacterota bacterium]
MIAIIKAAAVIMIAAVSISAVPAFPGCEGWGKNSIGGRGGQIIHVTNLKNSGTGSLRTAVAVSGPKIIVFDTAGVINLGNQPLTLNSNTTIAGQTAPGGITLINGGIYTQASNVIVRFIRLRRSADVADGDLIRITSANAHDVVFDHCSAYWCSDEVLDMSYACYNITIQNTVIGEPLQCHAVYGCETGCGNNRTGILSTENDGRITFYKMVLTHTMKRVPFCGNGGKYSNTNKTFEFINCLVYDCMAGSAESFDAGNTVPLNQIGNYYKGGPSAEYGSNPYAHSGTINPKSMRAHVKGNFHYKYPTYTAAGAFFNTLSVLSWVDTMIPPVMTTNILPAQTSYWECLASAGPLPRDSTDRRTFDEIKNKTGAWIETCNPPSEPYQLATGRIPTDTDKDGMPDTWETAKGLNINSAADATTDMGGYNAIEVYLNELADTLVARASVTAEVTRKNNENDAPAVDATPNPFNPAVRFTLNNMSSKPVTMTVYDLSGRIVYKSGLLTDHNNLVWNSKDTYGRSIGRGTYLVKFTQDKLSVQKQVTLIR